MANSFRHEFISVRRSFKKREIRLAVQFGVGNVAECFALLKLSGLANRTLVDGLFWQ